MKEKEKKVTLSAEFGEEEALMILSSSVDIMEDQFNRQQFDNAGVMIMIVSAVKEAILKAYYDNR